MMHQSIATIDSPEFINLQPLEINPLMSRCEIKVLYLGENRNHSYITKEVAAEMAKTLRGAPIVGYYKEEKEDFRDHGEKVVFDDEGMKFECMTKPYGFVAPDAKVWFQKFEDTDEFGNQLTREYLMTTGYLWTGQFEEAKLAIDEGRPQSMELDVETLDGHWSTNSNTGMDFFIINDAIFSKLCILGEDVEPCFEGASVTAPEVSKNFSLDNDFRKTLYTMMQDLKFALEGGNNMDMEQNLVVEETAEEVAVEETVTEEVVAETEEVETTVETPAEEYTITDSLVREETPVTEPEAEKVEEEVIETVEEEVVEEEIVVEENLTEDDNSEQSILTETQDSIEDTQSSQENFAKSDDEEDKEESEDEEDKEEKADEDKEDEEEKSKHSLEEKYTALQAEYEELSTKYAALVEFKENVENEKKDALIESFYMLSDEDKAEVVENKAKYSLEDIEAKLSVICVRKKVNFDLDDTSKNDNIVEDKDVMTYNITDTEASTPAWISALKNTRDNRK